MPGSVDPFDDGNRIWSDDDIELYESETEEGEVLEGTGHGFALSLARIMLDRYVTIEQLVKAVSDVGAPFIWKWLYHLAWPDDPEGWYRSSEGFWYANIVEYQAKVTSSDNRSFRLQVGVRTPIIGAFEDEPVIDIVDAHSFAEAVACGGEAWRARFPEGESAAAALKARRREVRERYERGSRGE